jgi:hypothetical protein
LTSRMASRPKYRSASGSRLLTRALALASTRS